MYISDTSNHRIVVLDLTSPTNLSIIGAGLGSNVSQLNQPMGLFATKTSLYVIDMNNDRIQKISLNDSKPSTLLVFSGLRLSYYLYVVSDDKMYVSYYLNHTVVLYHPNSTNSTVVAGTGVAGSDYNQLNRPYGLFVDRNETLYVADRLNHRIMKWFSGATAGLIVAGNGTPGADATQLYNPSQVIVDTNGYMYITESFYSRITRWAPNSTFGVCIAACTRGHGIASNQLNRPHGLAFDSHESIYVNDRLNNRIQKFILSVNRCGEFHTGYSCRVLITFQSIVQASQQYYFLDFFLIS